MVREGRWTEGRPALLQIPRLLGQTLGFIAFGRVARAVAKRAPAVRPAHDGVRPVHRGNDDLEHGVFPRRLGGAVAVGLRLHARAGDARGGRHAEEKHFRQMKKTRSSSTPAAARRCRRPR